MLDLALIRAEPARLKASLARRGIGAEAVDRAADLDARWCARETAAQALRARRRRIAEEVAEGKHAGHDTSNLEQLGRQVAEELRGAERGLDELDAARRQALLALPNLPAADVPEETIASSESAARDRGSGGSGGPLPHWDLIKILSLAHTAEGSAGRGFLIWRGCGARLVRALVALLLDFHTREGGFEEVRCPAVATARALEGSAHLPTLEDKMYNVAASDLYLAPRAEPHLANLYAGKVIGAGALPVRLVASGPAFRREAGAAGRDSRGLLRLHEFPTVEVYVFCRPEESDAELERAVDSAAGVLERLNLRHRRLLRGARQLSHAAARTIDLEVWAPGLARWLQVAAISSFTDYQARRTNTRFRDAGGKARWVHTVGGAAVGVPHLLAAILENGQRADGSVALPEALCPYMGGQETLRAGSPRPRTKA